MARFTADGKSRDNLESERQKELVIQDAFVYEKKRVQRIVYKADFCYSDAQGKTIVEDVKGFDSKSGKYMQTEAFRLKWKLLKAKVSRIPFRVSVE